MSQRTNDDQTYTNPRVFIKLMEDAIKIHGAQEVRSVRKYKVLRESWIAAMYAKAVSKAVGNLMYLRANPKDVMPDFFGLRVQKGEHYNIGENFEIEVFEWGEYSTDSLYEALKKKIEKYSSPETIFVCYAHKPAQQVDFTELSKQVIRLKPDIGELSLIIKVQGESSWMLVKLFPEPGMLYIPNSFAKVFYPKYDFAKKMRGMKNIDDGLVSIDNEMKITRLSESSENTEAAKRFDDGIKGQC